MKTLSILLLLLLFACEEVVQIDLEEGPVRLVVEARLEKAKSGTITRQTINLTTTSPYFSNDISPVVSGATVIVNDGITDYTFTESITEPGLYEIDTLVIEFNRDYRLSVDWNGNSYLSALEQAASVPPIDSIYIIDKEETAFDDGGLKVQIDYTDPIDVENYYYWQQFRNDTLLIEYNPGTRFTKVDTDELYNGFPVLGKEVENDFILNPGDEVVIKQMGITRRTFDYLFLLFEQVGGEGFFEKPPAQIRGNIQNLDDAAMYPLGYFYVVEMDERSIVIP